MAIAIEDLQRSLELPSSLETLPPTEAQAVAIAVDSLRSYTACVQHEGIWQLPFHDGPALGDLAMMLPVEQAPSQAA